tara:strand:+ start:1843 stop:2139 length:297 start_codon:yes stop_codon:yes gene_type:complete
MNQENLLTLIKSPYVTEQSAQLTEDQNQVVFKVDMKATKLQIKKAVELMFKVEVNSVRTSIVKGKKKRNRFGPYKRPNFKKAFVSLKEGSEIKFEGMS